MASIGKNPPTFAGRVQTIEAYILDFDGGDLYHRELEIQFLQRLRGGICKYDSPAELQKQIGADISAARRLLGGFHCQEGRIVLR